MYPPEFEQRIEIAKQTWPASNCIGAAYFLMGVRESDKFIVMPKPSVVAEDFIDLGECDLSPDVPIPAEAEVIGVLSNKQGREYFAHMAVLSPNAGVPREVIEREGTGEPIRTTTVYESLKYYLSEDKPWDYEVHYLKRK